jgi:hypothetical protein
MSQREEVRAGTGGITASGSGCVIAAALKEEAMTCDLVQSLYYLSSASFFV